MDGGEGTGDNGNGNESLGDHNHILEQMESFLVDIDEPLIISRMVSDSVTKGMVNAVKQQAAERIAQKELEVVELKKMLHIYHVGWDETKTSRPSVTYCEPHEGATDYISDTVVEHDGLVGSVDSLQVAVNEQLKQLKKEINKIRGSGSIRRINSGSDSVGLGGILQEDVPEIWVYVDKTFESLKDSLDTLCRRVEVTDQLLLKASFGQEELEFRSEIEQRVISNCIWSLRQEFEQKLWDLYDSESRNCFNQHKEISGLRQELDSIFKTHSVYETGLLISHGSLENGEEWCHNKRPDHFHQKLSTNHSSPPTLEENGNHENSKINMPENLDPASLKHMPRDELITYYNSEITKMKRNHESQVQEMTEENFRLKRELLNLNVRGSLPLKKDKDFDLLRKKIPDVISKLDKILVANEKVHQFSENIESLSSLKHRLGFLLSENHQLKDMLTDKKKEIKSLCSQLSAVGEELSLQQLTEKNLLQTTQKLKDDLGDAHAEVSIIQDVYRCFFEDITSETEELHLKNIVVEDIYESILKETAHNAQASSELEIEEAHMESSMMQGLLDINQIIFKEALVDANKFLHLEAAEKGELKQEMLILTSTVEEREKLAQEAEDALIQISSLIAQQQNLIAENNKELDVTKGELVAALEEIEQYKEQMSKLHQNLEHRMDELREIDEERRVLRDVTQKKQDALTLIEAKERKTRKQMESTVDLIHKLLKMVTDFEARVNEDISRNCLRLENMNSELCCIKNKANILKTTGMVYKQTLETAEAEVDLLGDEVDTLHSLLEKLYIALDHYSPILQHYPGIIEILELIRRELGGMSRKLV